MVRRNINGASRYHEFVIGLNAKRFAQETGESSTLG